MEEIVVTIAAEVVEYLVAPIGRSFGYLFNYRSNIDDLRQQVEKLGDARARLERSVDEAIRNGDEIEADVDKWLLRVSGWFMEEAGKFFELEKKANQSCFNGSCPNLKSQYQLTREAKKRARVVAEIQGDGKFERVSYRAPIPGIGSVPFKGHEALESRMTTLDEIMEALRDAHVNIIGVWGMAGVGKTTQMKQVAKQAEEEKLFDKVVMAYISSTPELKKIQGELADMLGLKFEEESEMGRAARLCERLKKVKKILIILDDIWTELDLEKVGIPFGDDHKGCKMVLTSRNKHVLSNEMGTQKDFPVEHLQEEEALILFKKMAGDSIEEPDLQSISIDVAKECAGLPIAIVTVAKALKNKGLSIWEDALRQLKRSIPTNIKGMDAMVYSTLELSYKHLEGDEVKSLFLLCGLMSNKIYIDDLLKYGMGLRLFQGTNTLEEAKNRIDTLVDSLKASKLLLDTGHNSFVRMHDVVRDVAIAIVSKVHRVFSLREDELAEWPKMDELQTCTKMSLAYNDICELPIGLVCPELELFLFYHTIDYHLKILETFFEGMKKLKVLDLSNMHFTSLPSSLHCLTNLRTLSLNWCKLGDISIIVELKKLEFLSFMGSNIEKLPREIAQLTHLRLFDLRDCSKLREIPPNVISSLSKLENLCMENSFTLWEVEGKSNASIAELKYLPYLTTLDIQIPDAELLLTDVLFEKLIRYRIFIGDVWSWDKNCPTTKTLKLSKLDTSLHLADGISLLLKGEKDLHLRELSGAANVFPKLDREGFLQLKHLHVERSPEMQHIMNSMDPILPPCAFPVLESLFLNQLINLQEVCHGQLLVGSFSYLRIVKVEHCDGLKFLFSMSMARGLSRLEKIEITRCKNMYKMVAQGKEDGDDAVDAILFAELRDLTLQHLPKLRNFCLEGKTMPSTTKRSPTTNVRFNGICSEGELDNQTSVFNQLEGWHGQLLLSFCNLRSLKIKNCASLLKVLPPSLLQNLQNLEVLIVENCKQFEEVFDLEGQNVDDGPVGLLPKLEKLSLIGLPMLRHICNKDPRHILCFQNLKWLKVHKCGSLRNLFPASMALGLMGTIIFPKLIHLSLESLPSLTSFYQAYHVLKRFDSADDIPVAVLFNEKAALPSLELLNISGLDNVKKIWHNQLPQDSFTKLKDVKVASCGQLLNIFPSSMLKRLQSLQFLKAVDCSSLEEVFDMEGINVKEAVAVTQLSKLILQFLPKVKQIWNKEPHGILTFQNLKSVMIDQCQSLKNLFPASLVRDLVQLQELQVWSCGIEVIVAKDNGVKTAAKFVFPKVTSLRLSHLHQLRSFYPGAHTSQWPLLKELKVHECPEVNLFAFETPTFQQIHHMGNLDMLIHQPLFLVQQVAFPNLEELTLDYNNATEIWQEQFPVNAFCRLRVLNVCEYGDILVVIPSFMLQRLHNLEKLNVKRCSSVKEIFQLEGHDEENQAKMLGRLREIWLRDLPGLTHLWKENSKPGLHLQSLESLEVWNCDSLINLAPCSVSFQNLDTLDVWSCGSLRSLISPLVAKSLVKLKKLKIGGSHMMEVVVENEGGEGSDEIVFCKLQHMVLLCLPNLTSFSSGGYIFSFPSLEHMVVEECPKMKIFSSGPITTPRLERVEVADDEWHWQDDLNTTIHNLFMRTHGNVEVEVEIVELGAGSAL